MADGSLSNGNGSALAVDDKKHSWASEVEEEEEAEEEEVATAENNTLGIPVYPGGPLKPTKKKKKKKKRNNKGGSKPEIAIEPNVKYERERIGASVSSVNALGMSHLASNDYLHTYQYEKEMIDVQQMPDDIRNGSKSVNVSVESVSSQSFHMNNAYQNDDGWQMSSSRKLRNHQSNQSLPPFNNNSASRTGPSAVSVKTMNSQSFHVSNGHQNNDVNDDDGWWMSSSRKSRNHQSNQSLPPLNNGSASRSGAGTISAHPARHDGSRPTFPPLKPRSQTYHLDGSENVNGRQWNPPAQVARGNIAENQVQLLVPAQVARANIAGNHDKLCETNHMTPSWPRAAENHIQGSESNILSKLLPSETAAHLRVAEGGRNTTTGTSRTEPVKSYTPIDIAEIPFPADSDSECSVRDLEDDSDYIGSDPSDSDASVQSLDTRKQKKCFRGFFQTLDEFSNEQILEHEREWHCPACQCGVGAIQFYRGLQPLIDHAKTRQTRASLHRKFAEVLEEELEVRRLGTRGSGTVFGKWRGLQHDDASQDQNVVWPPIVVIQNTQLHKDDQEKWIGMGNKELLDLFQDYSPTKARHSYGPQGHRGMSVVIFAESPTGYFNADRLATKFRNSQRGKHNWENPGKRIFEPGGDRILYGYMATAEDMEIFNRHCSGKLKLKWEIKKYQAAVVEPMNKMNEQNQHLHYYKAKTQKQEQLSKTLERSVSKFTKALEMREIEIAELRKKYKEQDEQKEREMDDMERTYRERIKQLQTKVARSEQEEQEEQEEFKLGRIEHCVQLNKILEDEKQEPKQAKMKEAIDEQIDMLELNLRHREDCELKKRELKAQYHFKKMESVRNGYEQLLNIESELENDMKKLMEEYRRLRDGATPKAN